jgi:hypothetical protein
MENVARGESGKQIDGADVKEADATEGCQRREPDTSKPDLEKIQEIKMG